MSRRSQKAPNVPAGDRHSVANEPAESLSESHARTVRELEAEIALYRHALEKARAEFQAFAYSVSHDLRAPLRAIEGFSKILIDDCSKDLGEEGQRFLKHIITNTQQLGSQIEDLLRFYRAGKNPPTKIDVSVEGLCNEVIAGLDPQVARNVNIEFKNLPTVLADPVQLREVFAQLISNAVKASSKASAPKIEIGARTEPGAVTIYVRDNGIGFDEKNSDRLFQVFQKLHSNSDFPGNGIGLAIVKRLVEAHGGCVSASSQPGEGAVFCFSLPRTAEALFAPPACAAVAA